MNTLTIHLVDDDEDLTAFLATAMETASRKVMCYASAKDFLANIDNLDENGCIVLDVNMPEMNGLELQKELNSRKFPLPIIFLTAHADVPMAVQAMQDGAADFIQKPVQPEDIIALIDKVVSTPVTPQASPDEIAKIKKTIDELTPRESEVMHLIVQGASNKEAAQQLNISPRTVEIYRATVMRKMDAPNLPDLVRKAISIGL